MTTFKEWLKSIFDFVQYICASFVVFWAGFYVIKINHLSKVDVFFGKAIILVGILLYFASVVNYVMDANRNANNKFLKLTLIMIGLLVSLIFTFSFKSALYANKFTSFIN